MTILLFDGECYTCNTFVKFVLRWDRRKEFKFAPLQSEVGARILEKYRLELENQDTIVLYQEGKVYTFSSAIFRVISILGWPWKGFLIFSILPESLTDWVYRLFARNRYRFFKRVEVCSMIPHEHRDRFLKDDRG